MNARLYAPAIAPAAFKAVLQLQTYVDNSGLEMSLQELVKMRASQINGCAFCLDMHAKDARTAGESEARLYLLPAWRESPLYSDRERAALAWTEALTLVADKGAPDDLYAEVRRHFSEKELADLTVLIGTINVWNRMNVAFRTQHAVAAGDSGLRAA
ncbi:MAG TPA: carboxymuconolactone decarboxylase family protein [Kiloniellales bacterium]|nr:carboxymuconolactone decarboxylase family protein [Kiloniellales bacterium]